MTVRIYRRGPKRKKGKAFFTKKYFDKKPRFIGMPPYILPWGIPSTLVIYFLNLEIIIWFK